MRIGIGKARGEAARRVFDAAWQTLLFGALLFGVMALLQGCGVLPQEYESSEIYRHLLTKADLADVKDELSAEQTVKLEAAIAALTEVQRNELRTQLAGKGWDAVDWGVAVAELGEAAPEILKGVLTDPGSAGLLGALMFLVNLIGRRPGKAIAKKLRFLLDPNGETATKLKESEAAENVSA